MPQNVIRNPQSDSGALPWIRLPDNLPGNSTKSAIAMSAILAELLGTMILILLGDGVVANVLLKQTKGHNAGWIVITAGWGFAVAVAVYCTGTISGAHLNPAVTLGMAAIGKFEWMLVPAI
jgi:glycerol uptake facilitator protein